MSSLTRLSRKGVTSRPRTPAPSASASAASIAPWTRAPSASAASGIGTPTSMPEARPSRRCAAATAAASAAESTRSGAAQPDAREKKAGNSSAPSARTATPCVSRYSSVRGMSRIDLTPALTTSTGVRPSSTRSALTSIDASPPRWTPPIPPVTKTPMPAACASSIVDDTVVPPCAPRAHRVRQVAPRHLADRAGVAELREALELVVAEPADADAVEHGDRARQRARVAHDRLDGARHLEVFGYGMPCEMMVDSSATTGRLLAMASRTSARTRRSGRGGVEARVRRESIFCEADFARPRSSSQRRLGSRDQERPVNAFLGRSTR